MSSFWSSPRWLQILIWRIVPKKNTWNLTCTRDYSGVWSFNIFPVIFNEPLVGGTEKTVDYFYKQLTGKKPDSGDRAKLTVSTRKLQGTYTTTLKHHHRDSYGGGNTYIDQITGMSCWLCPVSQLLFGKVPATIYVTVKPLKSKKQNDY